MKPRIISMAVVGLMIASALIFFAQPLPSDTIPAHIAGITGDAYSGSGEWVISHATVYDDVDVIVRGNVNIEAGGSLTIKNSVLTMDEGYQYNRSIRCFYGPFTAIRSTLTATNATGGHPWANLTAYNTRVIHLSNCTIDHFQVKLYASNDWVDNCTMNASLIAATPHINKINTNISYNRFTNLSSEVPITLSQAASICTGNIIEASCTQTTNGPVIWAHGGVSTDIIGTRIIKNHIQMVVHTKGILAEIPANIYISRNIIDEVYADHASYSAFGIIVSGEGKTAGGVWSYIDNNTIKLVHSSASNTNHLGAGIFAEESSLHWNIFHNEVWDVVQTPNAGQACYGIEYSGSNAEIKWNHIMNVTGNYTASTASSSCSGGIKVGQTTTNNSYVNTTWNSIDVTSGVSNAITYGWNSIGHYTSNSVIANNTIGIVSDMSVGIGIYLWAHHLQTFDNSINQVYLNASGVCVGHDVANLTISRNYIHVTNQGDLWVNPVSGIRVGAFTLGAEGYGSSGENCIWSENTIDKDTGVIGYPDFHIENCNDTVSSNAPRIIVTGPTTIYTMYSSFIVSGPFISSDGYYFHVYDNEVDLALYKTEGGSTWNAYIIGVDYSSWHFVNVTQGHNPSVSSLLDLTFTMLALGVLVAVVGATVKPLRDPKNRDPLKVAKTLINAAIFIIVGIALIAIVNNMFIGG